MDCIDPTLSINNLGQLEIANLNDVEMALSVVSGSAVFQNPIPAQTTVVASSFSVGPDNKLCFTGECGTSCLGDPQQSLAIDYGATDVPMGQVDEPYLNTIFSDPCGNILPISRTSDLSHMEIIGDSTKPIMRVKYDPNTTIGENGSSGTIWSVLHEDSMQACVTQTVLFEGPVFDYGGTQISTGNPVENIKVGYGLGGGSQYTSGGAGNNPCGWSLRWTTSQDFFTIYSYAYGRPAGTFGQTYATGVQIVPDTKYELKLEAIMNTDGNPDGELNAWIDGVLVYSANDVIWMDHTQCATSPYNYSRYMGMSTFYGGTNTTNNQWWPDTTQYIQYCDVSYDISGVYV